MCVCVHVFCVCVAKCCRLHFCVAVCCSAPQIVALCCSMYHTHAHCCTESVYVRIYMYVHMQNTLQYTAVYRHCKTHCNTLQQTAIDCNRLQQTATRYAHKSSKPSHDKHSDYVYTQDSTQHTLQHTATNTRSQCITQSTRGEVGGWGRDPFSRNFMKPTPRRKWYLTTGRRFH